MANSSNLLDFEFEVNYSYKTTRAVLNNYTVCIAVAILYLCVIFAVKDWMRNRTAFKLRGPLIVWNLTLAVFSILGAIKTWPEFIQSLAGHGFRHSVCDFSYSEGVTGFWTLLFALSKVIELGDTVFIVLRKQPLLFLHWYHHSVVLLFTWYATWVGIAPGRWYIVMNFLVHSLMYSYYSIRAFGIRLPKNLAMFVTSLQIIQMVCGCIVTYYAHSLVKRGDFCQIPIDISNYALVMYASYFLLFAHFFINSYLSAGGSRFDNNAKKVK